MSAPSELAAILAGAGVGWVLSCQPKAQGIRLADVLVLGPLMIYAATGEHPSELARLTLAAAGAATITYNARNYLCAP